MSTKTDGIADSASLFTSRAAIDKGLREILIDVLNVDGAVVASLTPQSGLFGSLPEIDSMAVANLITAIEDRFAFTVDDEDVDGEMLETFDGLVSFIERKLVEG